MIVLRSRSEVDKIRNACRIVGDVLQRLRALVKPGVTTAELDRRAEEWARESKAEPAFKGYCVGGRVFPATLCVSIDEEVVHGMPSPKRVLREGEIIGLDFGVVYDGYYGDGAITVPVAQVSEEAERLIRVTREALERGIEPRAVIADGQHEPGSFNPATNLHRSTAGVSGRIVDAFLEDQEHIPSNIDPQS